MYFQEYSFDKECNGQITIKTEISETPTKSIASTKTDTTEPSRESRLLSEMVTIRQNYNQSVFDLHTPKNEVNRLKDELESGHIDQTHDHTVDLNCTNLERLVKMLQKQLVQTEQELASAQNRKKEIEMKCEQTETDVVQKELEKIEQTVAKTHDENLRLNETLEAMSKKIDKLKQNIGTSEATLVSAQSNATLSRKKLASAREKVAITQKKKRDEIDGLSIIV